MNVASVFSGIGGLDYGLARAGFRHVFFCEGGGDPNGTREERQQWATGAWRRSVLAHHWPGVPIYEDVRDVGREHLEVAAGTRMELRPGGDVRAEPAWLRRGGAPRDGHAGEPTSSGGREQPELRVDLLCGGFPCQDVSVAGQRRGLAGDRSGLFHEFARIADAFRPQWVLVENVPGLLSSNGGRDFGVVLATLADIGYGLAWRILDSRYFGVPQRRRRVFILGALADDDPRAAAERAGQVLAVGTRCPGHPPTRGEAREDVAGTLGGGAGERGWAQDTERMTFVAHPLTTSNQRLGDTSQETFVAAPLEASDGHYGYSSPRGDGADNLIPTTASVRRLTPTECERLQALPDGWTDHGPDSRRYAALGDAVTASVAEWIGRRLLAHMQQEAA